MRFFAGIAAACLIALSVGCGDGRNAPSASAVEEANNQRRAAIDKDPSLSPEQKESLKSHLGGVKREDAAERGR
jgi:hypothetical protein